MKLLIISAAPFIYKEETIYAYSPYINELVIWNKYVDEISFCCPVWETENGLLVTKIPFRVSKHYEVSDFNIKSCLNVFKTLLILPKTSWQILKAMKSADHIHLRCPSNIGLLGCFIQVLFPNTPKTAKYAGNWDPNSKQPWTYRLQKWLLSNTFLTRNMQALVYGDWKCNTANIKPFFTATYKEEDKVPLAYRDFKEKIRFLFVGTLVKGKNPLYAVQLVEALFYKGYAVDLCLYGEGVKRSVLESYIDKKKLNEIIFLMGNQNQETVKKAFQDSHFVILPSNSEGWGKAITEGMFWGSVPLASQVSCIPFLLDYGNRGVLLTMDLRKDVAQMEVLLKNEADYQNRRKNAAEWSRKYTLDFFEQEIEKLIKTK